LLIHNNPRYSFLLNFPKTTSFLKDFAIAERYLFSFNLAVAVFVSASARRLHLIIRESTSREILILVSKNEAKTRANLLFPYFS